MPPTRKLNGPSKSLVRMLSTDQLLLYWFDRSNCSDWSLQILLPPKLRNRVLKAALREAALQC